MTFDPFMSLSVPIPRNLRHLPVIFVPQDPNIMPIEVGGCAAGSLLSVLPVLLHLSYPSTVRPEASSRGKVGAVEGFRCQEDRHPHDTCECVWVEEGEGGGGSMKHEVQPRTA